MYDLSVLISPVSMFLNVDSLIGKSGVVNIGWRGSLSMSLFVISECGAMSILSLMKFRNFTTSVHFPLNFLSIGHVVVELMFECLCCVGMVKHLVLDSFAQRPSCVL